MLLLRLLLLLPAAAAGRLVGAPDLGPDRGALSFVDLRHDASPTGPPHRSSGDALGWLILIAVVGMLGFTAREVRRAALPRWSGAPARLAEVLIALVVALTVAQLMGAAQLLAPWSVLAALLVACGTVCVAARRVGRPAVSASEMSPPTALAPWQRRVCLLGVSVVVVQWCAHAADALTKGMTHADTMIYHQPISASFLQDGHFMGLENVAYDTARYYPFNANLVQTFVIMPFGDDRLAPLVNLGWMALALGAAWVIGAPRGAGHLALLGVAAVLGVPALAGTQPGQASTDVAATALLITAIALLIVGRLAIAPVALAGLALGLAIGTKVTIAAPVLAVFLGVLTVAIRTRRRPAALAWTLGVVSGGSFWYLRNWFDAGSPLPWFEIDLGVFRLPTAVTPAGPSLVTSLLDGELPWATALRPGLHQALGPAWPILLLLSLIGAGLAIGRGRRMERIAGLSVASGFIGYVFTPQTGGLPFAFNVRYLTPVMAIGMILVATLPSVRWRAPIVISLTALVAVTATAEHVERTAAWPWPETAVALAILAVSAALVAVGVTGARRGHRTIVAATVATSVGALAVGAVLTTQHYLDARYRRTGLPDDEIYASFR
ncbi:MAG: hypothetical protein ACRDZ2_13495, partial [Ilumatobacteraceae bacterium]